MYIISCLAAACMLISQCQVPCMYLHVPRLNASVCVLYYIIPYSYVCVPRPSVERVCYIAMVVLRPNVERVCYIAMFVCPDLVLNMSAI